MMTTIRAAIQEASKAREITLAVVRKYAGLGSNLQRCVATVCAVVFKTVVELLWFVGVILTFRICCAVKQASEYDRRHRGAIPVVVYPRAHHAERPQGLGRHPRQAAADVGPAVESGRGLLHAL